MKGSELERYLLRQNTTCMFYYCVVPFMCLDLVLECEQSFLFLSFFLFFFSFSFFLFSLLNVVLYLWLYLRMPSE